MVQESKARKLHRKALTLRENKEFRQSLQLGEEGLTEYARDNDILGFAELLTVQAKTYIHAFHYTQFNPYLLLAKHTAQSAVDIVDQFGDESSRALPYFNLGEIYAEVGDLPNAVEAYKKAIGILEKNPPESHNRKSVLANFKIHLTTTEYMRGDKSALERAENALRDQESATDATDYERHVCLSGAHMRIAYMLRNDNPAKAQEHLHKAKEIIDGDSALIIRKDQWYSLSNEINRS